MFVSGHDHLAGGKFDPDALTACLERMVDEVIAAAFSGWRATGDTHWEMGPSEPDFHQLVRYEEMLDRLFINRPMVGIYQHDLRRMPDEWRS